MSVGSIPGEDRHWFYERAVQQPARLIPFLRRIHGGAPRILAEDFCGTAALCRAWLDSDPRALAIGLDHDRELIDRAGTRAGLQLECCDLRGPHPQHPGADLVFVGNYSIGELADRSELLAYMRRVRERLAPGGCLVIDTYGGANAWRTGIMQRIHLLPDGRRIHHAWEQRHVDALTQRVENVLHFRLEDRGEIVVELPEAFVYRWRLWGLAELVEAAAESGLGAPEAYPDLDGPPRTPEGESWSACLALRAS